MSQKSPLISIILSFRNEEEVIPELIRRLKKTLESISANYEMIFVNDASSDNSLTLLNEQAKADHRVKIISMSRKFGQGECALAGMRYSSGAAIINMDTDLQDPPEVIPRLIEKWREGAEVVYTVRTLRKDESPFKLWLTKSAYRIIHHFVPEINLTVEAGDFKLLSRKVVEQLLLLPEKDPYLRGMIPWLGFKQVPVYYQRDKRAAGEHHFPVFRHFLGDLLTFHGPVGTFISGLTSFSFFPLIVFLVLGIVVTLGSIVALSIWIVSSCFQVSWPDSAGLMIAIFFLAGVQLLGIGAVGLYLSRIYKEVRGRPRYIVESTVGLSEEEFK